MELPGLPGAKKQESFAFTRGRFNNKQTLLSQFSSKESCLKKLFGETFSIRDLITKLEQSSYNASLYENPVILGILLGYGIESSLDYPHYIGLDPHASSKDLSVILCAKEGKMTLTQLQENVTLCTFNSKVPIHPVSFIGDPHSKEVKNLKEIYSQELEKIERIYARKDLLRTCLEKLVSID